MQNSFSDLIVLHHILIKLIPVFLIIKNQDISFFGGVEFSIIYSCMCLTDSRIVGCAISSVTVDSIEPLYLLPMCLASLLLTIPNPAAALLLPLLKFTYSITSVDAVNLLLAIKMAAVLLFLFILDVLTSFSNRLNCDNVEETLSRPSFLDGNW